MIFKTSGSTESTTQPVEGIIGVDSDSRSRRDGNKLDKKELNESEIDDGKIDSSEIDDEIEKKDQKMSKSKNLLKSKKLFKSKKTLGSDFFTFRTRLAFTKLR